MLEPRAKRITLVILTEEPPRPSPAKDENRRPLARTLALPSSAWELAQLATRSMPSVAIVLHDLRPIYISPAAP